MTRTHRLLTLMFLILLAVIPALQASASQRTETKSYVVGSDLVTTECELGTDLGTGFGGACFELAGNEVTAALTIEDLTELPTSGAYVFRTAQGNTLSLGLFCGTVDALAVPAGAAELVVYVTGPAFGAVNCISQGSLGAGTTGSITVTYDLSEDNLPPGIDEERDCFQFTPTSVDVDSITEPGGRLALRVKVLLDGVTESVAEPAFAKAAESYEPLGIDLVVTDYDPIELTGDSSQGLIDQVKASLGGRRPDGVDVVYALTSKDIQANGQRGVAGQADCIGGVRYPDRAFAVGELFRSGSFRIGPITFYRDATARIIAHEIGHLLGGHHHYANCVEKAAEHAQQGDPPCTLMSNFLDMLGPEFGTLNGAIARGHVSEHAPQGSMSRLGAVPGRGDSPRPGHPHRHR